MSNKHVVYALLQVLGTKSFGWQGNGGAAREGADKEDAAAEGASQEQQQQQQQEPEINDDEAPTAGDIEVCSAAFEMVACGYCCL
jgi:hypothetical protein